MSLDNSYSDNNLSESTLDYFKIETDYLCESVYNDIMMEEGEEKPKGNAFFNAVRAIFSKIFHIITDFKNMLRDALTHSQTASLKDISNSDLNQSKIDAQIIAYSDAVDRELMSHRTLIQKIANSTGVSDEMIASVCDKGAETIRKLGPIAVEKEMRVRFYHFFGKKINERTMGCAESLKQIQNDIAKRDNLNKHQQMGIMKVLNSAKNLVSSEISAFSHFK